MSTVVRKSSFVIQFMLDDVKAFFLLGTNPNNTVSRLFWEIRLSCICLELFIGLEVSCRPISASFLIRTSGKEYHSQAGSTSLMKKLACPGYEVHLSKGHFHTLIIRPVSCFVSWHLPSPNDGVLVWASSHSQRPRWERRKKTFLVGQN